MSRVIEEHELPVDPKPPTQVFRVITEVKCDRCGKDAACLNHPGGAFPQTLRGRKAWGEARVLVQGGTPFPYTGPGEDEGLHVRLDLCQKCVDDLLAWAANDA